MNQLQQTFGLAFHSFGERPGTRWVSVRMLGTAMVINALLLGLFFALATPSYETNDDRAMQFIASGYYTGHPCEYLVFTNIIIGWALRFLYGTWGGVNWYFFYLVAVHYVALTAIVFVVLSRRCSLLIVWLYVGFFLLIETRILLNLQFTTTAFLAGTASMLLLVDGLKPDEPAHWVKTLAGLGFLGLSVLIREPVATLLALMAWPFVLERFGLSGWRRLLAIGLASAGIILFAHEINHLYYQRSAAWSEFLEYNDLRGKIHRTALEAYLPKAASDVGWSQNDTRMFDDWYFADPEVYGSVSKMRLLLDKARSLARAEVRHGRFPKIGLFLPRLIGGDAAMLMNLALLNACWCLVAGGVNRQRCLIALLVTYGACDVLASYLLQTARLPQRVSITMPLFVHVICLYWAAAKIQSQPVAVIRRGALQGWLWRLWRAGFSLRPPLRVLIPLGAAFYTFFLVEVAKSTWHANATHRELAQISQRIFQPVQALVPGQKPLLVSMPFDSVLEQCLFFRPASTQPPCTFVPYGWVTHSPVFREILDHHQLRPYSMSLIDQPCTFFVMESRWLEPLRTFYREHYGKEISFELVVNTDELPQYRNCHLYLYDAHTLKGKLHSAESG